MLGLEKKNGCLQKFGRETRCKTTYRKTENKITRCWDIFWMWVVSVIDACLCLVVDFGISDVEASGPITSKITWRMFSFVGLYITNQVSLWSRVPLQKLIVVQLVTKFPAFCITRIFIPFYTRPRDLSSSRIR